MLHPRCTPRRHPALVLALLSAVGAVVLANSVLTDPAPSTGTHHPASHATPVPAQHAAPPASPPAAPDAAPAGTPGPATAEQPSAAPTPQGAQTPGVAGSSRTTLLAQRDVPLESGSDSGSDSRSRARTSGLASLPRAGAVQAAPRVGSLAPRDYHGVALPAVPGGPGAPGTGPQPPAGSTAPPAGPSTPPAGTTTPPAGTGGSDACGALLPKLGGGYWACSFSDDFSGSTLDDSLWTAWNGYNFNTSPNTCYYDDPSHLWLSGGYLNLAVTKLAAPQPCWIGTGFYASTYAGALVHTKDKFSQNGGRFEARIKFSGGAGLHHAFWLWPQYDQALYPGHAEIDIAEPYGSLPDMMWGATHLNSTGANDGGKTQSCALPNWAADFHTYAIEWTSGRSISFFFDGVKCFTYSDWKALPGYADSAPFDQPFFMILQTLADDGSFSPAPDATTRFPAVTQVDWVRVWK